ncbi:MAG: alpha-glucan family phosphorylase [Candidatus Levybacteria bacterium]|nr:alpha-glucan family phosphorylase [Candidatus Levybacteria bacterium]MDZ4227954.1 alpha-glucan family phosphorylase [Candidatus Levybacteria bacterium]
MVSVKEVPLSQTPAQVTELFPPGIIFKKSESLNVPCLFFEHIRRPDLKEVITPLEPWSYWTAEIYGEGIKGQGGLGMLASDTVEVAAKLGIPLVYVTNFYRKERSYRVNNFDQKVIVKNVNPEERGFADTGIDVFVSTICDSNVKIDVYAKEKGSVTGVCVTEPNIGELYEGENYSDRRLYQNIVLGFGGYKALKALGLKPSMNQQLNEAPTVFSALARLDDYLSEVTDFSKALSDVRSKTIYTNHSNVLAAEPVFNLPQFEHFVMPNIRNEELRNWLRKKIEAKGGWIKLSTLAIELSGKKNGVSKAHAKDACKLYKDCDGQDVKFEAVTNGIAVDRWGDKELLDVYRKNDIIDSFDLPTLNFETKQKLVNNEVIRGIHSRGKERLRACLKQREDQYGMPADIPENAKIYDWSRRLAEYKRPGMLLEKPKLLAKILERRNIHLVFAGNAHPTDIAMAWELTRMLKIIDENEILKKRVHFIQNYDEELGKALSQGADVTINTPRVMDGDGNAISTEACGTGWMKRVLNNVILISTSDGGVADSELKAQEEGRTDFAPSYLQITGKNYTEEVNSLYINLWKSSLICDNKAMISWGDFVKKQMAAYLPTISGARMERDYINLGFPAPVPVFIAS